MQKHPTPTHYTHRRCVGYFCTSLEFFKHSEPHRTYTKHTSTEIARCLGCFWYSVATCVGCFYVGVVQARRTYTNHTLPELTVCRVLLHSFGVVQAQRTSSNLHEPHHHSEQGVKGTRAGLLKHLEPPRTYRKHTTTELALCVGCFCTPSGWFKHSEPTRTTPSQSCVGCFCTRAGWFKHLEPLRTYTSLTITELARCVGYVGTRLAVVVR